MSAPAPKRDKFAALAAHQQQQNPVTPQTQPQQQSLPSESDSLVPLAMSSNNNNDCNNNPSDREPVVVVSTLKRDKFASMAASLQHNQQQASKNSTSSSPPIAAAPISGATILSTSSDVVGIMAHPQKRDKFASLAAKQAAAIVSDAAPGTSETTVTTTTTTTMTMTPPPKRDKFASLAAKMGDTITSSKMAVDSPSETTQVVNIPPKRDKFASMSAKSQLVNTADNTSYLMEKNASAVREQELAEKERRATIYREMVQRCHQRDSVWRDLDMAEAKTIQLLQLAETTGILLAEKTLSSSSATSNNATNANTTVAANNKDSSVSMVDIEKIAKQYQKTVSDINNLLKPHAELVQPYRAPTRVNQMYQKRVELRIADSKRSLAQDYLTLQKMELENDKKVSYSDDNPQEIDKQLANEMAADSLMDTAMDTPTDAGVGAKRKRDELESNVT